jgi:hypothetical protein
LDGPKGFRHIRFRIPRVVNGHRYQKRSAVGSIMGAIDAEFPLTPEISFLASLRGRRDDGNEERAIVDLPADLPVPGISAPQLTLIEPDLDPAGAQRIANAPGRIGILRGIAQEYGS